MKQRFKRREKSKSGMTKGEKDAHVILGRWGDGVVAIGGPGICQGSRSLPCTPNFQGLRCPIAPALLMLVLLQLLPCS